MPMALCKPWIKTHAERLRQLEATAPIPPELSKVFAIPAVDDGEIYSVLPHRPPRGSWLAEHDENGQSVKSFERASYRAQPHATYDTIYLDLLGDFTGARCPDINAVKAYLEAFFLPLRIDVSMPVGLDDSTVKDVLVTRINDDTGVIQARTDSVLSWLKGRQRSGGRDRARRQVCCICLTTLDLYPDDSWNFVFGVGDLVEGFGVWSMARMDPAFPSSGSDADPSAKATIMRRSLKVICHEIGHLFGLRHCVLYRCLMNGSNHLEEMDSRSPFMCPVCLRKMHLSLGFDPVKRYQLLLEQHRLIGGEVDALLKRDVAWLERRVEQMK